MKHACAYSGHVRLKAVLRKLANRINSIQSITGAGALSAAGGNYTLQSSLTAAPLADSQALLYRRILRRGESRGHLRLLHTRRHIFASGECATPPDALLNSRGTFPICQQLIGRSFIQSCFIGRAWTDKTLMSYEQGLTWDRPSECQ